MSTRARALLRPFLTATSPPSLSLSLSRTPIAIGALRNKQYQVLPIDVSRGDSDTAPRRAGSHCVVVALRDRISLEILLLFIGYFQFTAVMDDRDYGRWPMARLKEELRLRGAVVHGKKKDLVER